MIRAAAFATALVLACGAAARAAAPAPLPVAQLLQQGFDIKAAFYDNSGGAYLVLQKATSAYLCHSSPNQTCEKLN